MFSTSQRKLRSLNIRELRNEYRLSDVQKSTLKKNHYSHSTPTGIQRKITTEIRRNPWRTSKNKNLGAVCDTNELQEMSCISVYSEQRP